MGGNLLTCDFCNNMYIRCLELEQPSCLHTQGRTGPVRSRVFPHHWCEVADVAHPIFIQWMQGYHFLLGHKERPLRAIRVCCRCQLYCIFKDNYQDIIRREDPRTNLSCPGFLSETDGNLCQFMAQA